MENEVIRFGTQLAKYRIDENLMNELLEVGKKQTNSYNKMLVGRIEEEYGFSNEDKNYFNPKILPFLKDYVKKYVAPNAPDIDFSIMIDDYWINLQVAGEFNPPHIHVGHLSFVIYVQIPDEINKETKAVGSPPGSISFTYMEYPKIRGLVEPDNVSSKIEEAVLPKFFYIHKPQAGELLIFPSFMNHFVESFETKGVERISIAGNAFINGKYKVKQLL